MRVVEARGLSKVYRMGKVEVAALRRASLDVDAGESVAIMGPSGSGKSTLLFLLGLLLRPTAGTYRLQGREVGRLPPGERARLRARHIGFVFQTFNLIPGLSALRNVELPALYNGMPRGKRRARARELLERVGLGERLHHRPAELSGGEAQRVAIARALMNDPLLVLADEPTGNLDSATGQRIMGLLAELCAEGRALVVVTHNAEIAERWAHRVLRLRDGVLEGGGDGNP